MGKRGPKPKGPYSDKAEVLSTRMRADTKRDLMAAAKKAGRNLSQEIEHRLRRSFAQEQTIIECLGGEQLYAILRTISLAMQQAGRTAWIESHRKLDVRSEWLHDPFAYDMALQAIGTVLEVFRPPGDIRPLVVESKEISGGDDEDRAEIAAMITRQMKELGQSTARWWLSLIASEPPGQPIPSDKLEKSIELARRIGDGLQELHVRLAERVPKRQTVPGLKVSIKIPAKLLGGKK